MLRISQEIPFNNKLPSLYSNDKSKLWEMSLILFVSEDSPRRKNI